MTSAQPHTAARHDFDFLFGRWIIHNRKLAGRPQPGGTDWVDFSAQGEARPLLGGRRFTNGHGVFFGDDVLEGRPLKVRFDWTPGAASARWEQAFSYDDGQTWEKNWIMSFVRA